jgi:hypothetical protein
MGGGEANQIDPSTQIHLASRGMSWAFPVWVAVPANVTGEQLPQGASLRTVISTSS